MAVSASECFVVVTEMVSELLFLFRDVKLIFIVALEATGVVCKLL